MKRHFIKLIFGSQSKNRLEDRPHVPHFDKIRDVWHNSNYNDFGIERIFRLFLVTFKIFFPGVYLDYAHRNYTYHQRKIRGELYVIFKTVIPFAMLFFGLWNNPWLFAINIYLLVETYVYIFHKIFLPEHNSNRNYNRSLILLFFNFTEVIGSYGVIYAAGDYLNQPVENMIEALYFSLITGATVGYGDIYPIGHDGKLLVMSQLVSTLSFLLLFFNFFAPRAQDNSKQNPDS